MDGAWGCPSRARDAFWAFAHGGVELGRRHFAVMKLLHGAFFVACAAEVVLLHRPFVPALAAPMVLLAVAALVGDRVARPALERAGHRRSGEAGGDGGPVPLAAAPELSRRGRRGL